MPPLSFIKITSGNELHDLYSEDIPAVKENPDYNPDNPSHEYEFEKFIPVTDQDVTTKELVIRQACTKMILLNIDGKPVVTDEWFITYGENELIYHIQDNRWVNLNMFNDNTSYCSEIYYVKGYTNDNI